VRGWVIKDFGQLGIEPIGPRLVDVGPFRRTQARRTVEVIPPRGRMHPMKFRVMYGGGVAAVTIAAIALGAPAWWVVLTLFLLAAPLIMIFIMGKVAAGHNTDRDCADAEDTNDHRCWATRP